MINTVPAVGSEPSPELCRVITAASDIDSLLGQGKIEVERRTFAGPALHSNFPGVFLNNSVGHRQPESSAAGLAFARRRLGGEERIVNPVHVLLRNAAARIRNHYADAVAIRRGDAQRSTMAHGVLGIQE